MKTLIISLFVTAVFCQTILCKPYNFDVTGTAGHTVTSLPTPLWDSKDSRYESTIGVKTLVNESYDYHLIKDGEAPSGSNKIGDSYSSGVGTLQTNGERAGTLLIYDDTYVLVNIAVETVL